MVISGLPNITSNVQGYAPLGDADYVPLHDQNNLPVHGSVSWIKGAHSIKMGAGVIRRQGTQAQAGIRAVMHTLAALIRLFRARATTLLSC